MSGGGGRGKGSGEELQEEVVGKRIEHIEQERDATFLPPPPPSPSLKGIEVPKKRRNGVQRSVEPPTCVILPL